MVAAALGASAVFVYALVDAGLPGDLAFVKYHLAAAQHLEGLLPPVRRMDFSPLYFEFVAALERLQAQPELALGATRWFHLLATGGCVAFLYLVLVRRVPRGWALVGSLGFALSPHLQVYSRIYEPEILLLLALLGFVVATDRDTRWAAFAAGLCAAAATASRPTFLLVFLVLGPLGFALRGFRGWSLSVRSVCFFAPLLVCGLWLGVRAQVLVGDPFAPVMNPGTVFFEGNHPLSRGTSAAYPISVASLIVLDPMVPDEAHNRYRKVARSSLGRRLTTAEVNEWWAGRAWNFISDEPRRALANGLGKLGRAMREVRLHDVGTAERLEAMLPILPGLFGVSVALAGLGLVFERRHWRRDLALLVFGVAQLGVMSVFYVSARQQMVLLPTLVFFALAGARGLWGQAQRREATTWVWAALAVGLLVFSFSRDDTVRDIRHRVVGGLEADRLAREVASRSEAQPLAALHAEVGDVLASAAWVARENLPGNLDRERRSPLGEAADRLAARGVDDFFARFDLATLELEAGRLDEARQRFEALAETGRRAYRTYNQASDPAFYLGRIAALEGRRADARAWLERALAATPGDPYVLAELSALGFGAEHRHRLERYYGPLDADLLVGEALLVHGRDDRATEVLARAYQKARRLHRAAVGYAAALGSSGEVERAVDVYERSLEVASTPILWSDRIVSLYIAFAQRHAGDPEAQLQAAGVLGFHGRFGEALALLGPLPDDEPGVAALRDRLQRSIEASEAGSGFSAPPAVAH